jgi:hypothetical protein
MHVRRKGPRRVRHHWAPRTDYMHSRSPESDTTTVPVCLSRSREVDMIMWM